MKVKIYITMFWEVQIMIVLGSFICNRVLVLFFSWICKNSQLAKLVLKFFSIYYRKFVTPLDVNLYNEHYLLCFLRFLILQIIRHNNKHMMQFFEINYHRKLHEIGYQNCSTKFLVLQCCVIFFDFFQQHEFGCWLFLKQVGTS